MVRCAGTDPTTPHQPLHSLHGGWRSRHVLDVTDAVDTAADAGAGGEADALLHEAPQHGHDGSSAGPSGRHAVLEHMNESVSEHVMATRVLGLQQVGRHACSWP